MAAVGSGDVHWEGLAGQAGMMSVGAHERQQLATSVSPIDL
jgi:hypothetical protein